MLVHIGKKDKAQNSSNGEYEINPKLLRRGRRDFQQSPEHAFGKKRAENRGVDWSEKSASTRCRSIFEPNLQRIEEQRMLQPCALVCMMKSNPRAYPCTHDRTRRICPYLPIGRADSAITRILSPRPREAPSEACTRFFGQILCPILCPYSLKIGRNQWQLRAFEPPVGFHSKSGKTLKKGRISHRIVVNSNPHGMP
jgi:hypothetical protein